MKINDRKKNEAQNKTTEALWERWCGEVGGSVSIVAGK